jgi:C-terminal processing protease CtpA/Prc
MKIHSTCLAALGGFVLFLPSVGSSKQSPPDTIREGAKGDLKVLIGTTKSAWAYLDDKKENFGVDLDRLSASAVSRFESCKAKTEVFEVLREVVAGLKDGHAFVRLRDLKPATASGCVKGRFRDTREGVVFEKQLVLQWNGCDVQDELKLLTKQVYASTPGMARQLALEKLTYGPLNQTVRVKLKSVSGAEEEKLLRFETETETELPPLELHWPEKRIAHLAIRTFDVRRSGWGVKTDGPANASGLPATAVEEVQKKISEAFNSCAKAQALILDLRGNRGGTDSVGSHVALHLLPGEFIYFKLQTRYSPELKKIITFKDSPDRGWSEPGDGWKPPRPPSLKPFEGPAWVLLDELCFSTTDNLLACLRDLLPKERGRFLGRPSGGGTGAPRSLATLPFTGAQLTLTVMKVYSPKGRLIEGRGTIPDREIAWTWNDVVQDKDPDLEAALAEARAKLKESPAGASGQ